MHLPRRLVSAASPAPSIQLALNPNSRRASRLGDNHHLWRNGRLWWIAYTLLHDGWRQERIRHSLGTTDRDRGEPRDSPPPTPPGIRITYHGDSVEMVF